MRNVEHHLRAKTIAILHDIQGWLIGRQLRELEHSLRVYKAVVGGGGSTGGSGRTATGSGGTADTGTSNPNHKPTGSSGFGSGHYNPNQPRVPAGQSTGGQWTSDGSNGGVPISRDSVYRGQSLSARSGDSTGTWGRPSTLDDHVRRHGKDFGTNSPQEYTKKANEFYKRGKVQKLPTIKTKYGVTKIYDPKTNTFGSYNKNGTTKTFYKPKRGAKYFDKEIRKELGRGGRVSNMHNLNGSPEHTPHRGTRLNPTPYTHGVGGGGGSGKLPTKPGLGPFKE